MYVLVNCKLQSINTIGTYISQKLSIYIFAFHSSQNIIFHSPDMDNFERLHFPLRLQILFKYNKKHGSIYKA